MADECLVQEPLAGVVLVAVVANPELPGSAPDGRAGDVELVG
jgi:hypothetical protein